MKFVMGVIAHSLAYRPARENPVETMDAADCAGPVFPDRPAVSLENVLEAVALLIVTGCNAVMMDAEEAAEHALKG